MPATRMIDTLGRAVQLILHISLRSVEDRYFGVTKLNKILYYTDAVSLLKRRKTISGFQYVKQDFGPTPAPTQYMPLRQEMIDGGMLALEQTGFMGRVQKRPIALVGPNLEGFDRQSIEIVDEVIEQLWNKTARECSDFTHEEIGWKAASMGAEIPMSTYLLNKVAPTPEHHEWARQAAGFTR